ncbi:MAG: hypothetical protein ACRDQX_08285 [Pseudonocardiaceae bacterium]
MDPYDDIGAALGDAFKSMVSSAFEAAMTALWEASLMVLRTAFELADRFSVFSVSTTEGPLKVMWPMMLWISGMLAIGLFSWQLIMTALRGGRGFLRLVTGPVQYGIALAVTVGMVAAFLAATDGLTDGILSYGLGSKNFADALTHTSFAGTAENGVKAVVLGICAIVGVIPAAVGFVLEMLFREAAIDVLVCTVPLVAAGLLANVTASWFWKTTRWLLAAIAMKPVLALTLVLGVAVEGGSQGLAGLLAGVGVLVISLVAPFLLFRLFAFVDPHSDAGGAFRELLSGEGVDSYGEHNPAMVALAAAGQGGSAAMEDANTGRFEDSTAEDRGDDESCTDGHGDQDNRQDGGGFDDPGTGDHDGGSAAPAANSGRVVASDRGRGRDEDPPPPEPGGDSGGAGADERKVLA